MSRSSLIDFDNKSATSELNENSGKRKRISEHELAWWRGKAFRSEKMRGNEKRRRKLGVALGEKRKWVYASYWLELLPT